MLLSPISVGIFVDADIQPEAGIGINSSIYYFVDYRLRSDGAAGRNVGRHGPVLDAGWKHTGTFFVPMCVSMH